ncbi:DNA cytosine methyltransferase [uncultured Adlercreutzia sp.]|uniref:DNA cytosine methyltransferase n=1 Tax=uncultured Adlercreutzia sp. TaxID=875803 RepID=UPI002618794C|nr:DNA cytosine methyltransferase [uncultured Adlercreutzia sp.]MCI9260868.1 DNA cytosine methyltransferase [Eggerthellaceae bacterium]
MHNSYIQVVDFFSGAGGTSLGFSALNSLGNVFEFLGGCDIDQASATTYSTNFGTPLLCRDILDVAQDATHIRAFLEELGYDATKPAILIGCPPCQGFTSHRKRHWDKEDDRRNNLAAAFARIVDIARPTAFVMENVPEFLSSRYRSYYSRCMQILEDAGYKVKKSIYNSAAFGVPQERYRSIVIGMRREFCLPDEIYTTAEFKNVRDAIADLPVLSPGETSSDPLHRAVKHKASTIETIRKVPRNGGSLPSGEGPACRSRTKGFADVYGRLSWDKPSITVTHYARNPASGRFVHPEQDRGLTAREAARLQSFPDNYLFSGGFDDIYRQIGEAVPPLLACGVASYLLANIILPEPTPKELEAARASLEEPVSNSYSSVIAGIKYRRLREQL